MIRIGLVGVNTSHADAFTGIFNNGTLNEPPRLDAGKVVAIWGSDPAEMIGAVDAVLADIHHEWQAGDRRYLSEGWTSRLYPEYDTRAFTEINTGS